MEEGDQSDESGRQHGGIIPRTFCYLLTITTNESPGTPFLDRQAPLPERSTSVPAILVWFGIGITVAGAVAISLVPASAAGRLVERLVRPDIPFQAALLWLAVFALYIVAVAVHELGHLAAGLLSGFAFQQVRVSLIVIDRSRGLSISPNPNLLVSGETNMLPPAANDVWRYAVLVAGGPTANAITAVLAFTIFGGAAGLFAGISLVVAVSELLPMETRFGITDGLRLRMLYFDPPRARRWLAIVRLTAESAGATAPEKMSPDLIAAATVVRDPSRDTVTAYALAYSAAMSRQAFPHAGELLDVCLQYVAYAAPGVHDAFVSDAAFYQAAVRCHPELARQWLQDLSPKAAPWLRLRVETAILEVAGDLLGAWRELDGLEKAIESSGGEQHLLPLVRQWKVGLQNKMPIATPPRNPPPAAPAMTPAG